LFFTPKFVYKVKKPVNFGFLVFTTLKKRHRYCKEEVRLNRRLSKGIYLDVVKITQSAGKFRIAGKGKAVEYAVKMRRIPERRILQDMLLKDKVTGRTLARVARAIASFHKKAKTSAHIRRYGSLEAVKANTAENFSQTKTQIGKTLSKKLYKKINSFALGFLKDNALLFAERMKGGFIRDCHGDIHAEHISISKRIDIIDCIEFNERFRYSDTVSDIAFLLMDIDFLGRADLSRILEEEYFKASRDAGGRAVLDFYKCHMAYVRGKVEGFKYMESEVEEKDRFASYISSLLHYRLAGLYAQGGFRPVLVIVRGLSGSGKSTVAEAVSNALNAVLLSSDVIRKKLAGAAPGKHRFEGFKKGIYSEDMTEKTYSAMAEKAFGQLASGRNVVLDATFSKTRFVQDAVDAAKGAGADLRILECACADDIALERISKRLERANRKKGPVSDMRPRLFRLQKKGFESISLPCIPVATSRTTDECVRHALTGC
ncbi:MAG: AAA family ATPase, partial [Deltaproteobacteria bacterium]